MPDVRAELAAEFALSRGLTRLERKYHSAPLKIAKTFRYAEPERDQLGVYVMDCSPGLMSGDAYRFDVELGGGTSVFWTNQSFTKVHPSLGTPSVQQQHIRIDAGALLELMPEPVMLYAGASLESETDIRMESGSTLLCGEVLCPGRTHRGESFAYERFAGKLAVRYADELAYCSRLVVEPARMRLSAPAGWGGRTHMATFLAISDRVRAPHAERLRAELDAAGVYAGVSLTHRHGVAVTMLGSSAWQLQRAVALAWAAMRGMLLGLPPLPVRK